MENTLTDSVILNDRKDRLLAKLDQRNEERKNASDEASLNSESAQIDQLMKEIRSDLDSKSIDNSKIERLQDFHTFSVNNRQAKAIQNLLEDVRKFKLTKNVVPKFTGFSFKKSTITATKKLQEPSLIPVPFDVPSASESNVSEISNQERIFSGKDGDEISLKNVNNCRLQFNFNPSVVHIRNVRNSTLLFLRCDRSVLMHDCQNLTIFVAAQQIRIHTSEDIRLHVATRGAVILEDSTQVILFPYRLKSTNGEYLPAEDNGEWRTPRDFNWLATTPSPNWKLMPEHEWKDEQLL